MVAEETPARPMPLSALSPNVQGALWILASVAGATAMTLAIRELSAELHTVMLAFLRSSLALIPTLPFLMRARAQGRRIRYTAWKAHLLRGLLLAVALNAGFYSIWKLPLATAAILFFLAPVFATLLAGPMLGEHVGPRRWAAVGAGFLGAVIILRPDTGTFEPAAITAALSSAAFSAALLLGRIASERDGTDAVFVSSSVIVAVVTLPPALFFWAMPGSLWQWAILAILVIGSSLRTYADIRAYAVGEAGFIAPFTYLRLITVGGAGYLLYDEKVDAATIAGGAIIIGSTLYIAIREHRLKRARGPASTP